MTTLPANTMQHIKSVFKKYQIMALLFTVITIVAAFLTVISGFQLNKLRQVIPNDAKNAAQPVHPASFPVPAAPVSNALEKQIKTLESQLAAEKSKSRELNTKIQELEKKLAAAKNAPPP